MKEKPCRMLLLLPLLAILAACNGFSTAYKAYGGERLQPLQISTVEGAQFLRQDLINRYVDAVRFATVDGTSIANSNAYTALEIAPRLPDLRGYFYRDPGRPPGPAPALGS